MTRRADPREIKLPVPSGQLPPFTPVPRQRDRHDGWTDARQRAFIEALADTGSVHAACKAVNMSQPGAYQLRRQEGAESFRKAWEAALALGVQRIEDVAMDRALNGVDVPVYSYGKLVGTRKHYNDRLLMFMLRNRAPERFADGRGARAMNALDHTKLEQEKKKWRKEWELEQEANSDNASVEEIHASLDRKIEAVRRSVLAQRKREWDQLSDETKAAHAEFERLKERDLARLNSLSGGETASDQRAASAAARPSLCEDSQANGCERRRLRQNEESRPAVRSDAAEGRESEDIAPPDGGAENIKPRPAPEGQNKNIEYSEPPLPKPPPEPWDGIRRLKDESWD